MAIADPETYNDPNKQVGTVSHVEKVSLDSRGRLKKDVDAASDSSAVILDVERRTVEERHLVRKLDTRLMPMIILIFIMNYIDVGVMSV